MPIRVLPDFLINQIAAGEVVERPASVVKELVENALDAGADQIVVDVVDGGRTMISVIDNGCGMSRDDLAHSIQRHATSKLPTDDLLNINFMGFRGEALPSIASVSDMTIDTNNGADGNGWVLDCNTGEIRPSAWDAGTRIRVKNLFARTPARLKFLRGDRAEMMSVLDVIKRLAMARADVGFTLNNKWRFPKNQDMSERLVAVMGDDIRGRMLAVDASSASNSNMRLRGYISEPTLRRATSVDQFLFVNNRPVRDKVLIGALRAAYMDVMHAREFPLCALYLDLDPRSVDVNVSPAKTDVHFLEPSHVRAFIIKSLRDVLAKTLNDRIVAVASPRFAQPAAHPQSMNFNMSRTFVASPRHSGPDSAFMFGAVGSTASKLEDINTSVMPITLLFVIAFIVVMMSLASNTVDTVLMKVCSFVPFTSPMAMFTRIAMSTVPWYEIAASIAILVGSVIGVGVLSAKIYRVGVLLYGTPPKMGAIIRAIRKA